MPPPFDERFRAILNLLETYPDRWSDETMLLALSGLVLIDWGDLACSLDRIEGAVVLIVI